MAAVVIPAVPDRRYTLFDQINRISLEDSDLFQVVAELDEHVDASHNFRWHAIGTQKTQDRVRHNYRHFLRAIKVISDDMSDEDVDRQMFLVDKDVLTKRLKMFIMFVAKFGRGRSQSTCISYRGLVVYRSALVFWCNRMASVYNTTPLPRNVMFNMMTEAMRYATRTFGITTTGNMAMSKVGLAELRQMIDFDMITTPNISVAEIHHLAWCIGRVCALRPGSLAKTANKRDHDGRFTAKLVIRNLKTNYEDPEKTWRQGSLNTTVRCIIKSPQHSTNLIFSIPHRLLIIALRRGVLHGIETLDQLLCTEKKYIAIKEEFLDKPILLAGAPRGLKLTEEPMRAAALTEYISLRGKKVGYAEDLTFYSLRRRAATDLSRKIGKDAARSLMSHDADSRILEKYYLSLEDTLDVSGLALDELDGADGGHTKELLNANDDLALHVLNDERARQVHGPALNALMTQMMAGDEDYPILASASELKNYKRRVRRAALKTLLCREVQEQRREMKQTEYDERMSRLTNSHMTQFVLTKARQNLVAAPEFNQNESSTDEHTLAVDESTGLFIHDVEELPEEDLEDQVEEGSTAIHRELDEGNPGSDEYADDDLPYIEAVRAFMQLVLDNSMSGYTNLRRNGAPCPRCQEDETISQELKDKKWNDLTRLHDHQHSQLHLPKQKWVRKITQAFEASGEERIPCPYCKLLGDESRFTTIKGLMRHIANGDFGAEHDRLKRADGWYDANWDKHSESKSKTYHTTSNRRRKDRFASYDIRYSQHEPTLVPIPHSTIPGLVLAPGPRETNRPGLKLVSPEEIMKPDLFPERHNPSIKYTSPSEPWNVSEYFEGLIATKRKSGA
ncbi:hypothetical protein F66182_81 [Fusarium sp. NRRL 66182]|nr:hypothetical protein F66182_81 [Fusarium sp. NRRL 66182]